MSDHIKSVGGSPSTSVRLHIPHSAISHADVGEASSAFYICSNVHSHPYVDLAVELKFFFIIPCPLFHVKSHDDDEMNAS